MVNSPPPPPPPPPPEPWPFSSSDEHGWPTSKAGIDPAAAAKALFESKLDVRKARTDEEIARAASERATDLAIEQEYFKSVLEVAKGSLERTRISAETVQKAAGAVVTIYTGILALAFSVSERPLPPRALYAALLLGIAIVLSTGFLAYLPDSRLLDTEDAEAEARESSPEALSNIFIKWSRRSALDRAPWLRASVLALGMALVFLPAPFISSSPSNATSDVAWPTPDPAAGTTPKLQEILYSAQVEEARDARATPLAENGNDATWFVGFLGALALVIFIPLILPGGPARKK
jgi:hypothetical protein